MPRPPRADEAGGLYHALNRGNARTAIFRKRADYEAFERILAEALERYVERERRITSDFKAKVTGRHHVNRNVRRESWSLHYPLWEELHASACGWVGCIRIKFRPTRSGKLGGGHVQLTGGIRSPHLRTGTRRSGSSRHGVARTRLNSELDRWRRADVVRRIHAGCGIASGAISTRSTS